MQTYSPFGGNKNTFWECKLPMHFIFFSCGNVWLLIIVFSFVGGSNLYGQLIKTPPPGISFFSPEVFLFGVVMVAGSYI